MSMGQCADESFCSEVTPNSRLLITPSERRQILLGDYIKGFNLSYRMDQTIGGVELHPALQTISSVKTLCPPGNILVMNTQTLNGGWTDQLAVLESDGAELCVSVGRIAQNRSVTFLQSFRLAGVAVTSCLSLDFLPDGRIVVGCQNTTHGMFWQITSVLETSIDSFVLTQPIVKILRYQDFSLLALSSTFLRIYNIAKSLIIVKEYVSKDFDKESMNMTDLVGGEQLVLTDYLYGCFRFSFDANFVMVGLENYQVKDSFTLRVAQSDARYYVMTKMDLSEVFWADSFRIGDVYQIPECNRVDDVRANQRIILIESDNQLYIYQRGLTNVMEVLAKFKGRVKALLSPTSTWMLLYVNGELRSVSTDVSYLSITYSNQAVFTIQAVSSGITDTVCTATIEIQPIKDLLMVYPTLNTLKPSFTIPIKSSLVMPVGNYYQGLNLAYSAHDENNVKYSLRRANPTALVSIYSKNPLLTTKQTDQSNFYRLTTDVGSINIERCFDRETNILCTPLRTKKIATKMTDIQLFDSALYGCLLTYLTDDPYSIFIEDIAGKWIRRLQLRQPNEFTQINDYSMNSQYIFVTHQLLNRINVYSLADFSLVGSITNSVAMGGLFRPKKLLVSRTHPQLVYIRNVNSLLLVSYNGQPTLICEVPLRVKTLNDQWTFIHDMSTLIIVYSDAIEEWSINSIEKPVFLKQIPLMGMNISRPIRLDYTNQYLVIECLQNKLLMIKTGTSAISSVFMILSMPSPSTFHLVATTQLLLMYNNGEQRIVQRIYPDVQLEVIPTYKDTNEFVEEFPIRFQVSSPAETKDLTSELKVVNYQKELKESTRNRQTYQLPTSASSLEIILDDMSWFEEGAVIWYQLQCDYCPDKFVPTYHAKRVAESKGIRASKHLMPWYNGTLYVLTNQEVLVTDLQFALIRPPIVGVREECSHLNRNEEWMLVFCKEPNRQGYFLPINMQADHPTALSPILIAREFEVQNILKSAFVGERLMVLDNNITGDGVGLVRVFKTMPGENGLTLECELTIDGSTFNLVKDTRINGFELTRLSEDTFRVYFTVSTMGLAICRLSFSQDIEIDCLLNDYLAHPPSFMSHYLTDSDQILQLKVISTDHTELNSTHAKLNHVVVVTHALSAHFELSLKYIELISNRSLLSVETSLIQAFNRYGTQLALNWLEATVFNADSINNMFLVSYANNSRFSVSMGIYPISTNIGPLKDFQNIKGGSFIETTDISSFSAILLKDSDGQPLILNNLLPDSNMNRRSQPVLNRLSNHLKVTATYDKPSEDQYILFRATNDYSEGTYKFPIKFDVAGKFAWYWILVSVLGFVLLVVSVCLGYRRYRIRRQKAEKESLLTSLDQASTQPPELPAQQ